MTTNEADVPMFDIEPVAVRTPKRPRANGKPRWSKYRPKDPLKCDDCMLLLAMADGHGPVARMARHRRVVDAGDLLLCDAHAQVRRDEDGLKPLEN